MNKNIFYILLFLATFISCTNNKNTETFFGGKIINPKSRHVVLYSMKNVIDTLKLDARNKFINKYKGLNEGLYYFVHGVENQYIYIEPQDSLMLRLNTWDFDESLVYTGKGAERNNILIDCFLENENDNRFFYALNELKPNAYKKKVDSILAIRLQTYNSYITEHPNETEGYKKILKTALTFPIYSHMESYPIEHVKYKRLKSFPKIDAAFYDYRKKIDLNSDSLMYYTPYAEYIRNYLYNITYSLGHKPMMKNYSSKFTMDLLSTINSKIDSEDSKNAFLKRTVLDHFYKKSSCNINENTFQSFFEYSSNKEDKELIKKLLSDNKTLKKGTKLKGFPILDFTNHEIDIEEIIKDKKTVLYFWNPEYVSRNYIASKFKYFKNNYKNIQFLIVKIDGNNKDQINRIDIKDQYFINAENPANSFLTSKMPRTILINKNGIIENGFASISSPKIYTQLRELNKN
ncbi:hypothetical protein FDT66_03430 [Polaribacter aestuariivivens]|uniref:Thioredoxin domain-containing protein n=1 Tax=Polaribacter aestuariivivens TaxID=2304626 RepID=A0A5S3N7Z3_9FLAO|nr:hypothetical protein [Polaribacter aestuariivivens]TMM31032.1 hypothetical protein FDT66_03430 [Polaribacter aestuariivivens]